MQIENALRSVHSVADLSAVIAALGHQALHEAVPCEAWNTPRQEKLDVVAVGRSDDLPWFAVASHEPERDALRLGHRITSRGKAAVVLALDTANHRLAVAAAFDRVPLLSIDLSRPDPEVLASLNKLAGSSGGGPLAFAARAAEALSTEPVSRRFFRQFRSTVEAIAQELPCPLASDDRHSFALLQLTRVLFLYFVQTKGWLSARDRFLAEEVDRCVSGGKKIHRDLLKPLFFGTLNRPQQERSRLARRFGPIPFLNGGLFEPHPLERRCKADVPNVLWCAAFDQVFERFHFTVSERSQPGSVAPDMLGRVFEGVMSPAARRASGTFYTPASLVREILEAGLMALLASRLKCKESEAHRRFQEPDPPVARILRNITLLDPAAGSGAFLLCALELLSNAMRSPSSPALRKRSVLQQNLFGVDLNAAAVRLAELRLWLAVIADEPGGCPPDQISPLPNLDCLIRQGDSLFEPAGLRLRGPCPALSQREAVQLAYLRREVIAASGQPKRALERRLRTVEAEMFAKSLDHAKGRYQQEIAECIGSARARDLFGKCRGLDRELINRLRQLRSGIQRVRQAQRRLRRDGEVPWFHYPSHFADVFARGGFDLVVGNPPWLRAEAIAPAMREQLAGRYRWWRSTGTAYGKAPDLAVAFLERGLELAAPGGVLAMLVPAKIASAGYGSTVRHALSSTTSLHVVADLTATARACFEATVYPLAVVARKALPAAAHQVRTSLRINSTTVRQSDFRGGGPWILTSSNVRQVVTRLTAEHPSLNEVLPCHLGVKTGLNRIFLDPPDWIETEVVRWAIRGRDLSPFRWRRNVRLLWTHTAGGRVASELPPAALEYLRQHEQALRSRQDYRGGVWWTMFRVRPAHAPYRVIWADLSRQITAAALSTASDRELIPLNSCYVAPAKTAIRAEAIAAWLNSAWIRALARAGAVPASGGFARFNASSVGRVPLAISALDDGELAQISRQGRAGLEIQEALDAVVARHLRLSPAAQRILRGSLA